MTQMNKSRILELLFDRNIMAYEIPYFRASVIESTKRQSNLFHNHKGDNEYIYRYPLIQYKIKGKKPLIYCLDAATDDIHYLLENQEFYFDIKGNVEKYEIEELKLKKYLIQTWQNSLYYNVHNYMPLNQENYETYKKIGSIKMQIQFLEEKLQRHIKIVSDTLQSNLAQDLWVKIININSEKFIEYKGIFHLTFSLNIESNISLPNYIGIGKGVAQGFGIVKQINDPNERSNRQRKNSHRRTTA